MPHLSRQFWQKNGFFSWTYICDAPAQILWLIYHTFRGDLNCNGQKYGPNTAEWGKSKNNGLKEKPRWGSTIAEAELHRQAETSGRGAKQNNWGDTRPVTVQAWRQPDHTRTCREKRHFRRNGGRIGYPVPSFCAGTQIMGEQKKACTIYIRRPAVIRFRHGDVFATKSIQAADPRQFYRKYQLFEKRKEIGRKEMQTSRKTT